MKLTNDLLSKLIQESVMHGGSSCSQAHPEHTHSEWEQHKKDEEKKTKSMAKISIKIKKKLPKTLKEEHAPVSDSGSESDSISKDKLRSVLKKWKQAPYKSDRVRWQKYAKDIEKLIGTALEES